MSMSEELIQQNMKLVPYFANKLRRYAEFRGIEFEDLMGEGYVGLVRTAKEFDPDRGLQFSTLAGSWIHGLMLRYIRDKGRVHIPRNSFELQHKIRQAGNGHESPQTIARQLGVPLQHITRALFDLNVRVISTDSPIREAEGKKIDVKETIPRQEDFTAIFVQEFVQSLSVHERFVVDGTIKGRTQCEIGTTIGISQVQVSRIIKRIRAKLSAYCATG